MTRRIGAIAALAATGMALSGCGEAGGSETRNGAETARTINVEVVEVQPEGFIHYIDVVGAVEAQQDVTVSAEEGGVVEAVLAEKGQRVRAGQSLLKLNDDVLRAELDQAESQAALARETWERQRRLWEQDSVGTEIQYLEARYNAETAAAQATALRERVARTTVRAPVAGVLDARMVEVGSMVTPGTPVARVLDLDTVEVVAGVPERYARDIDLDAEVVARIGALGGTAYDGHIDFVGSSVATDSRTFDVEVVVANPGLEIKPGMVADIRVARRTIPDALAVPRHAVLRRESGYVVYVARDADEGWVAEARAVTPGVTRGDSVVIADGLAPGDRVVVVGQQELADGDRLRLTDSAAVPDTTEGGEG